MGTWKHSGVWNLSKRSSSPHRAGAGPRRAAVPEGRRGPGRGAVRMSDYGSAQEDADVLLELLRARPITVYPDENGGPSTVPPAAPRPYVSTHFVTEHI